MLKLLFGTLKQRVESQYGVTPFYRFRARKHSCSFREMIHNVISAREIVPVIQMRIHVGFAHY